MLCPWPTQDQTRAGPGQVRRRTQCAACCWDPQPRPQSPRCRRWHHCTPPIPLHIPHLRRGSLSSLHPVAADGQRLVTISLWLPGGPKQETLISRSRKKLSSGNARPCLPPPSLPASAHAAGGVPRCALCFCSAPASPSGRVACLLSSTAVDESSRAWAPRLPASADCTVLKDGGTHPAPSPSVYHIV